MAFHFKTQGREYSFTLESDGLLHAKDLGLKAETVEALKPLVIAAVKEEKKVPRIAVIFFDGRWDRQTKLMLGSASGKADQYGYRWVSYNDGKQRRAKLNGSVLFLDTPENRRLAQDVVHRAAQLEALEDTIDEIKGQMAKIGEENGS